MLRAAILLFLTLFSSSYTNGTIQLSGDINTLSDRISQHIASVTKNINDRRLQSLCGAFELELDDLPLLAGVMCKCTEDAFSFTIFCEAKNLCIKHTKGQMSSYMGDLFFQFDADFAIDPTNPIVSDVICFDYDEVGLPTGCVNDSFSGEHCSVSVGEDRCSSCSVCNATSVSFDCDDAGKANECAGDSFEGTPIQFLSFDALPCYIDSGTGTVAILSVAWITIIVSIAMMMMM